MNIWPDPDSPEMGHLVDQWLVSLRKRGMRGQQVEDWARRLARAVNQGWHGRTPTERQVLEAFWNWYQQSDCPAPQICSSTPARDDLSSGAGIPGVHDESSHQGRESG